MKIASSHRINEVKSLEVHVAYGCNLNCRSCAHCSPLEPEDFINIDKCVNHLQILAKHLRIKILRLLGGEPLLNENIVSILEMVKQARIADKIYIATNGLFLKRMPNKFFELIDGLEISIYKYSEYFQKEMINFIRHKFKNTHKQAFFYKFYYFREPFFTSENQERSLVQQIYDTCVYSKLWQCFNYHQGHFFKCPQAFSLEKNIFGYENYKENGIKITDNNQLGEKLLAYINSTNPLSACKYCCGAAGLKIEIEQVKRESWKEYIKHNVNDALDFEFLVKLKENMDIDLETIRETVCIN